MMNNALRPGSLAAADPRVTRRRSALLQSVSLGALVVAASATARPAAAAAPFRSLSEALSLAGRAATSAVAPKNAVTASAHASLGAQNLSQAAVRFRSLAEALTAASGTATTTPIVIDGVGPGTGLQVAPGAVSGGKLWQGATLPTSKTTSSGITVTVTQTQPLANLTWQTFNVGRKTTLNFDQSAGGTLASSWVVINKVLDPTASGSQILGAINAQGKVYVLNRNGIAFTQGATINVGSLIAATSDIAASQFTTTVTGQTTFNLYGAALGATATTTSNIDPVTGLPVYYAPTFGNGTAASITVASGAVIQTSAPTGNNGGGYVMLLGGNVANNGIISTPLGQTVLAAGTAFTLRQGSTGASGATNALSTTLGSEVAATNYGTSTITGAPTVNPAYAVYNTGSVSNAGIVVADQGDISLVGHAVVQSGVLLSTTTVNQRGTIHFLTPDDGSDPTSTVTLAPGSVTEILPEDDGETALDAQRAAEVATSTSLNGSRAALGVSATLGSNTFPVLNNTNLLPDQTEESRVEISTGGNFAAEPGALVLAQGGQIAVGAGSRLLLESGATLDVSGTTNAVLAGNVNALDLGSTGNTTTALSASVRALLVNVQPFQLRDSAANRDGGLKGTNVYVDAATLVEIASGAYAGNIYTPGGLLEVSGYLGLVPHTIGEFTSIGGQVTLQAQQRLLATTTTGGASAVTQTEAPGSIVTQAGSVINLQGGTVSYQAAALPQTYVQATDGAIYDINSAPTNLVYTGIYDGDLFSHPRWKVTFDYLNPLLTPPVLEQPAYTVGRDAGSIVINAGTSAINGAIYAGVTLGQYQNTPRPAGVTDPFLLAQTVVPLAGTLDFGEFPLVANQTLTTASNVVFQATPGSPIATVPTTLTPGTSVFDATQLNADALANIIVTTTGSISVLAPLSVGNGGTVSLTGGTINVGAGITARSGAITLTDQLPTIPGSVAAKPGGITLSAGGVLDARGVWTNEHLDPTHQAGAGYAAGGTVTIASTAGVDLATGSKIDVSSGGGVLALGTAYTGRGGSVYVTADIPLVASGAPQGTAPVTLNATFAGYASGGGGTLSLVAPLIELGTGATPATLTAPSTLTGAADLDVVRIDSALLSTGFAKYVVNGTIGLDVLPGAQITAAQPIYTLSDGLAVPSGSDPSAAYTVVLPLLYTPTQGAETLTQRAGASLTLASSLGGTAGLFPDSGVVSSGGSLSIGAGAHVSVDPGSSITLAGYGQVSVLGTLTAHGGSVTVANTSGVADQPTPDTTQLSPSGYQPGVSIWIGADSFIDVSGLAEVQTDIYGRRFGLAQSGGAISLGSLAGGLPTFAQVIVRPGAVLDADGASAAVQVVQNEGPVTVTPVINPVTLVGAGGRIAADSIFGVALDGTVRAHAGGANAAGGTLALTLDASNLVQYSDIPTYAFQPQRLVVTQNLVPIQPATGLAPGDVSPADTFGQVRASQQQIDDGGFGSVDLSAPSAAIVLANGLSLHAAQSIELNAPVIGGITPYGQINVAAPYVALMGATTEELGFLPSPSPATVISFSTLTVMANLIDQGGALYLGGQEGEKTIVSSTPVPMGFGPPSANTNPNVQGFAQVNLESTGDIRFLGTDTGQSAGLLNSVGNLLLRAEQIYPATLQSTVISAGISSVGIAGTFVSHGVIDIEGAGGGTSLPYSIGGGLTFIADTIVQGGVVRAPEGTISFSDDFAAGNPVTASQITFAPGSVTSVSLIGQTIPYGGTVDGVTYTAPGGGPPKLFNPAINVQAQSIDVQDGASIDLRGGGTLSGAGFIFGRGGSADVLTTPLLDLQGGGLAANAQAQLEAIAPARSTDPVYAILPGYAASYAPPATFGDTGYTPTTIGEQITIGNTVPGLAAGTYTLLPAYYALLPGGYRVELTSGTVPQATNLAQGNFTVAAPVNVGTANTAIVSPVTIAALFTSGTNVRQLSQYDEESYNTFEAATATQFGAPRPFLPQDAKTLTLTYPSRIGSGQALSFAPSALLKAPATGGYGATLQIGFTDDTATFVVTGNAPPLATSPNELVLQAPTLDALDVPRLVLGGVLTQSPSATDTIKITPESDGVIILPDAKLTAGDILLTTSTTGLILVAPGGTLSTIGAGPAAYDNTDGFFLDNTITTGIAAPALDVSNGRVVFAPNTDTAAGAAINVGDGSGLLAGGSLDIVAPTNTQVTIGAANLGAQYVNLAVAAINIGSAASLASYAGQLPSGFSVTPQALSTLLNGNAALGTPAATQLTLTASEGVNILGSVTLDSGTTDLVLNTPAIYGVGTSADGVTIKAPVFTWSGVATQQFTSLNSNGVVTATATPQGQIAAGLAAGNGIGQFSINAGTIVLGYGPQTQPDDQVMLQSFVAGFSNVTLSATSEITANNQRGLSVFQNDLVLHQTSATILATGTGGNLTLSAPLITTGAAAVLDLTAGGTLSLASPGTVAPTASVPTLGGEIDAIAGTVDIGTAIALRGGRFNVTAQNGIDVSGTASIDLSGRGVSLFDQTVYVPGGTLAFESTAGSISLDTGSRIDVSATGTSAGGVSFNALAGGVALDGTLLGSANAGQTGGSFTVIAGTLSTTTQAADVAAGGSAFDNINAGLNAGGFTALRSFELGTDVGPGGASATSLTIDNDTAGLPLLAAQTVRVTTDIGNIDVTGTISATGTGPGSIALYAQGGLTLAATALLDAHATQTAVDTTGAPIDAENRAHVTLTAATGTLTLAGGAIDVSYAGGTTIGTPQGQVVLNAPRLGGATGGDVAIDASAPIAITGAQSIALYGWTTYTSTDPNGRIVQTLGGMPAAGVNVIGLDQIDQDSQAFINAAGANASLAGRLAGLITYGASFHLRPGVEIDSSAASHGNLTIANDIDFSGFRYSDAKGYGLQTDGTAGDGSGEPGAILFRAANDLIVNGSVTDGFSAPPDKTASANYLKADDSWVFLSPNVNNGNLAASEPLSADVVLPSSISVTQTVGGVTSVTHQIELGAGTTIDESRAVSLNYAITINSAAIGPNVVVPFAAVLDPDSPGVTIPNGGFVTTAAITPPTGPVIPAGTFLPGGTVIQPGSKIGAGTVLPVIFAVAEGTVVPAGTLLSIFDDVSNVLPTYGAGTTMLTLAANTAPLPTNAFIPSNTDPQFVATDGQFVGRLDLRPVGTDGAGDPVQGYVYALSKLLPAGAQSWDLDLVSGANQASADPNAVLPRSVLNGGALAAPANTIDQAPGSLILSDTHYITDSLNLNAVNPAFSVLRTGTGDLSLVAGGNFDQSSLFGIYTAGTQDTGVTSEFELARESFEPVPGTPGRQGIAPGGPGTTVNRIVRETYQANYPTDGGDVLLSAQGNAVGDIYGGNTQSGSALVTSNAVGNWLWRQGGSGLGQSTAWWINYGTFAVPYAAGDSGPQLNLNGAYPAQLVGFQGIGTLGGGNLTVDIGQNAGQQTDRSGANLFTGSIRGEGLILAVASTGREVTANGTTTLVETGGGNLTLHVGGTINPIDTAELVNGGTPSSGESDINGTIVDLRGTADITAGAIGRLDESYSTGATTNELDPRPISPFIPVLTPNGGITLLPGDGALSIDTQRDLVLDGVGDPGRVTEQSLTSVSQTQVGTLSTAGGATGFTLWTQATSVSLFSSGGNAAPITVSSIPLTSSAVISNDSPTDDRFVYPSQLYVTAASGNIEYGSTAFVGQGATANVFPIEVAPSANEQVAFLAGTSIQANGMAVDLSGADPAALSTPLNPAYTSFAGVPSQGLTDIRANGGTTQSPLALFAEEEDTPATSYLSARAQATPALFYAGGGDILDLVTGETLTFAAAAGEILPQWYLAAKPVRIVAAQDIISSGTRPLGTAGTLQQNQQPTADGTGLVSGDLFLNNSAQSVSVVSAGRDILSGYFYVGGPGLLEVDAVRNIQQIGYSVTSGQTTTQFLSYGSIKSLGSLLTGAPISLTGGASIEVAAGLGAGLTYTDFADLYLNPANQANLALLITDPANKGKVQQVYATQLVTFLQQNFGYSGTADGALAFFLDTANVPAASQEAFLRGIFFQELLASGQQYNDPNSRFFHSYLRGQQAIDALFATTSPGVPTGYTGGITMASGSVNDATGAPVSGLFDAGVATERGGTIQVLDPGGQVVLGTTGAVFPGGGTGLITNGFGDIDVFSLGSVLLGKSRVFTNAGGNIQIWSATGDINAGIGARTTVVFNPPVISYDNTGGLVDTPAIPTSGSGIATNQPLPTVPLGNIDLTAPVGTIDAGEAGVRSSGNLNLAASRLANTSGFSAGGKTSGNSAPATVSLGAVEAAGAAAGAGQQAAQNLSGSHTEAQLPSIIEVEVLSVSGESEEERRKKRGLGK